jgi:hypothetical protein
VLCRIWRSARSNADAWTEFIFLNQFLFVLFLSKSLAKSISKAFFCIKVFIFKENGSFDYKGLKMADLNKDGIIVVRDVTKLQKNISK